MTITDIRVHDEEPGLRDFEASFVRLLDKICDGSDIQIDETGTSLRYRPPRHPRAGSIVRFFGAAVVLLFGASADRGSVAPHR